MYWHIPMAGKIAMAATFAIIAGALGVALGCNRAEKPTDKPIRIELNWPVQPNRDGDLLRRLDTVERAQDKALNN